MLLFFLNVTFSCFVALASVRCQAFSRGVGQYSLQLQTFNKVGRKCRPKKNRFAHLHWLSSYSCAYVDKGQSAANYQVHPWYSWFKFTNKTVKKMVKKRLLKTDCSSSKATQPLQCTHTNSFSFYRAPLLLSELNGLSYLSLFMGLFWFFINDIIFCI